MSQKVIELVQQRDTGEFTIPEGWKFVAMVKDWVDVLYTRHLLMVVEEVPGDN